MEFGDNRRNDRRHTTVAFRKYLEISIFWRNRVFYCISVLADALFFFFLFWESNDFFKSFLSIVSTTTTKETNDDEDEDTIELARERILGNEFIALICKDQSRDRFE